MRDYGSRGIEYSLRKRRIYASVSIRPKFFRGLIGDKKSARKKCGFE